MICTPDYMNHLGVNEIFVFGSNEAGCHASGAARTAVMQFGAVMGQGEGLQGQSYAIPTMGGIVELRAAVLRFLTIAANNPDLKFFVTRIGTGIAGYSEDQIKPLFTLAPSNVVLPEGWR